MDLLVCLNPFLLWLQTTCWKKVSLIVFRQILPKYLLAVHIFSFIITTYLKNFIGIKSLSTKQCPAELSPWIIPPVSPILPKIYHLLPSSLMPLPCMDCPASSFKPTVWGKPCKWRKNPIQQQKIHISGTREIPLIEGYWILYAAWQKNLMIKIPSSNIPRAPLHLSMLFKKPCFNYFLF